MNHEIMTLTDFAKRMKIGRSTLFDWLRKGVLIPGKHYIKVGRVLRFVWTNDLIESLLAQTVSATFVGGNPPPAKTPKRRTKQGNKNTPPINWDY